MRKTGWFALLLAVLAAVACEDVAVVKKPQTDVARPPDPDPRPLLPPPSAPVVSDTADTFSFSQPKGAGSDRVPSLEIFGYEVYYRFSNPDEVATDRNLPHFDQLRANGFVSLRRADDRHPLAVAARPLIEVPSAARAEHRVTLSFAALEAGADPHATLGLGDSISLRRGVEDPFTGEYERFACDEFESNHPDVVAYPELPQECAAGDPVQLQLYAVAYGRDAERNEQFSQPLYLGSIEVTFRSPG